MASSNDTTTSSTQHRTYRPEMTTDTVPQLVSDLYGLHVVSCRELDSYDDRNFHVRVDDRAEAVRNEHLPGVWPHGYVFKVLNSLDSKKPEVIEAKITMTLTAAERGFPTPRPVPSLNRQLYVLQPLVREQQENQLDTERQNGGEDQTEIFLIRLMEYLPGSILGGVTLTFDLGFQIGQYAARLDRVLKDADDSQFPELLVNWNLQNVPSLRHLTRFLNDAKMASVVSEVVDAFETRVLKSENGLLQTGLIHSDFNDHNILVEPVKSDPGVLPSSSPGPVHRVCGILDFGDATKTFLIVEIAIAMAYLTLLCPSDLDPDEMTGHALAGYLSELPLSETELELLPLTICARMAQTLTTGYHRKALEPDNDYCLTHARKVWVHLQRLWSRAPGDTVALWRGVAQGRGVTL